MRRRERRPLRVRGLPAWHPPPIFVCRSRTRSGVRPRGTCAAGLASIPPRASGRNRSARPWKPCPTMLDLVDAVALSLGFGAVRRRVVAALRTEPDCPFELLAARAGTTSDGKPGLGALRDDARRALERAARRRIDVVAWGDARYPPLLAETPDPPLVLWVRGQVALLASPSIAIVGSRAASSYGLEVASRLGADVAAHGFAVVSGLARGID